MTKLLNKSKTATRKYRRSVHQSQGYCGCKKCEPAPKAKPRRTFDVFSAAGWARVS